MFSAPLVNPFNVLPSTISYVIISLLIFIIPELGKLEELDKVNSVTVADMPLLKVFATASNVTSPAEVVDLIGVTSFKDVPSFIKYFKCVPMPKYLLPSKAIQLCKALAVPVIEELVVFLHPANFSGLPARNLIRLQSNQCSLAIRLLF